jgi:hypothetical protein
MILNALDPTDHGGTHTIPTGTVVLFVGFVVDDDDSTPQRYSLLDKVLSMAKQ